MLMEFYKLMDTSNPKNSGHWLETQNNPVAPPQMASAHAAFNTATAASRCIGANLASYHSSACSPSHALRPASSPSGGVRNWQRLRTAIACVRPPSASHGAATRLYVSGLSFRTTDDSLRNAFEKFGELTEVHLVMDRVAKLPRGFAFLSYADEEEAKAAIEGMHGKYLDGRVIFVQVAKRRSGL
ncbi:hypothetical protein QOZ80_4BG0337250 [Eleusine coracana subsp. coracana]|nr:hypothetical protein QOZ80_4BG0337250 [Eleusine coracana subsp. coracana]